MAVALLTISGSAQAHHPAPMGPGSAVPVSRAGLQFSAAEFNTWTGGFWQVASLSLEQAFFDRFSITGRLPIAHVGYSDGYSAFGPGDMDLGTRVLIATTEDGTFGFVGGFAMEMPTGNEDDGLGDGHFMATPMLSLVWRPHVSTQLTFTVSDHVGFGGSDEVVPPDDPGVTAQHVDDPHAPWSKTVHPGDAEDARPSGSVLSPHSEHEMRMRLTGVYDLRYMFFLAASDVVVSWTDEDNLGPVTAIGGVGTQATDRVRVAAEVHAPIVHRDRLRWQALLGVEYFY